jgi:A/G-specific adenine glycosylase
MNERMQEFCEKVWDFYREHGRDLPWRGRLADGVTPYAVLVSEVMLQQTQVSRVLERWGRWLVRWPGFAELAEAPTAEVLAEWQGMGYNRRALWLKAAAGMVMREFGGELPRDPVELMRLPGVGPNTAGSIAAFAYEAPTVFIETNIRRVFLHEFFGGDPRYSGNISDHELRPLVAAAVAGVVADRESPREWYWALMDYGSDLVKRVPNPNRRSRHYAVQSKFEGSVRQLRGEVLRQLVLGSKAVGELGVKDGRLSSVLEALEREGFIVRQGDVLMLAK